MNLYLQKLKAEKEQKMRLNVAFIGLLVMMAFIFYGLIR